MILTEEVPLQLQMELIDIQCSEDLKSKFFAFHILNFYKNYVFPFGWLPNIIIHIQYIVSMFSTT